MLTLELLPNGFVRIDNNGRIEYRPTNSHIVLKDGVLHIVAHGGGVNNIVILKPENINGELSSPPLRVDTIDNLWCDLQQYFNPNISSSNSDLVDVLNDVLAELKLLPHS